jgi:spermidine/putrescine transport system permease protein
MAAGRYALALPSAALYAVCFVVPAAFFFVVSFWRVRSYQLTADFTLDNYASVVPAYGGTLVKTLLLAAVIAGVVTVAAFAFAYLCRFKAGRFAPLLLFIALLTLFGGYLTKIYMWRTILGANGILNTSLASLGLIDEPITAFLFNPVSVVITLGHYLLPFAILPLYGSLQAVRDEPIEAARDLGASGFQVFRQVVLPQCTLGIATAFTLAFLFAVGDFATARMVGGPDASLIGVFIQGQFTQRLNQPMGSAMAFTTVAASLAVVAVFTWAVRRGLRYR